MGKRKTTDNVGGLWFLLGFLVLCVALLIEAIFYFHKYGLYMRLVAYIGIPLALVGGIVFYVIKNRALFRLLLTTLICIQFFVLIYIILESVGLFKTFTDIEQVRKLVLSTGNWGRVVFFLIQLLQVVVLPVPAIIFYIAGIALYGAWVTFFISGLAVILGSLISFAIGRWMGDGFVSWIVGKEEAKKYRKYLGEKGKFALVIMLLFPFFPDDVLCMVAGLTTMSWLFFTVTVVVTRTLNVGLTCFLGSGEIIPFHGWGIAVWLGIVVVLAISFFFINRYKEQILSLFPAPKKKRRLIKFEPKIYTATSTLSILPEKMKPTEKEEI